jgi:hypothetical protein
MIATTPGRQADSAFDAPFICQSGSDSTAMRMWGRLPFGQTFGYPKSRKVSIRSLIDVLLGFCRPLHVALFIMTIVINSIQGVWTFRPWPQFGKELFEGFKATLYSACSVTRVFTVVLVVTSGPSVRKRISFRGISIFRAMSAFMEAITGITCSSPQMRAAYRDAVSTITHTVPKREIASVDSAKTNDKQFAKTLACQNFDTRVDFFWILTNGKLIFRHEFFSLIEKFRLGLMECRNSFSPLVIIT